MRERILGALKKILAILLGVFFWTFGLVLLFGLAFLLLYVFIAADDRARQHSIHPSPSQSTAP